MLHHICIHYKNLDDLVIFMLCVTYCISVNVLRLLCLVAMFSLRSLSFAAQTVCIPYAMSTSPFLAKRCYLDCFPFSWSQFSPSKLQSVVSVAKRGFRAVYNCAFSPREPYAELFSFYNEVNCVLSFTNINLYCCDWGRGGIALFCHVCLCAVSVEVLTTYWMII